LSLIPAVTGSFDQVFLFSTQGEINMNMTKYYKVSVIASYIQTKSRKCWASKDFYIEANSEEEAEDKVLENTDGSEFNFHEEYWEDGDDGDDIDYEVDELEELDPVENKKEIEDNLDIVLEEVEPEEAE
jgi:hypothetical protein